MKNNIRTLREANDMNQRELGDAVGVSRQSINAIETERYNPSLELAFKLAVYFDCKIEDIFEPEFSK